MNPIALCGTPSGANRHRRIGEPVCDACRASKARASRDYKAGLRLLPRAPEDLSYHGGWVRNGNVLRPAEDGQPLEAFGEWVS